MSQTQMIEGDGAPRPVAICSQPYSINQRRRDSKYASRFKNGYDVHTIGLREVARAIRSTVYSSSIFKDGVRLRSNFVESHYCVLDIDEPGYSLDDAVRGWCDTVCVIGTTASHRRPKAVPTWFKSRGEVDCAHLNCDRFRIITPWSRPITCEYEYKENLKRLVTKYGADGSCVDAARLWFPCVDVVYGNDAGYLQPVVTYPKPDRLAIDSELLLAQRRAAYGDSLPVWIHRFVANGAIPAWARLEGSRKHACFNAALELRRRGWSQDDVGTLLQAAKFDRADFEGFEIDAAVESAYRNEVEL